MNRILFIFLMLLALCLASCTAGRSRYSLAPVDTWVEVRDNNGQSDGWINCRLPDGSVVKVSSQRQCIDLSRYVKMPHHSKKFRCRVPAGFVIFVYDDEECIQSGGWRDVTEEDYANYPDNSASIMRRTFDYERNKKRCKELKFANKGLWCDDPACPKDAYGDTMMCLQEYDARRARNMAREKTKASYYNNNNNNDDY